MFKTIGEVIGFVSITVNSLSNVAKAAECQSQLLLENSEFSVKKRRKQLDQELRDFEAELSYSDQKVKKKEAA